ncbi:IS1595 family transposase [Candidatus Uhrbacteria bacterium]|nr:IS1595 family transposase [Candidatus Uhrbacteria bacterium]
MASIGCTPSPAKLRSMLRRCTFGPRPFCPRCRTTHVRRSESRYRCPKCRRPFSIQSASWLHGKKLSDRKLWILLRCWQERVPLGTASRVAGVSPATVRRWYRQFSEHLMYASAPLRGTVEIDEAFIGKRRHGNQRIVIGAIERDTNRIVLQMMPAHTQEASDRFLLGHVEHGSAVCTDGSMLYEGINQFFSYLHIRCNHSAWYFGPTNRIEAVWSVLKRRIRRMYHHVWKEHLPNLLREFEARWNAPELFQSPFTFIETSLVAVPTRC